ncbi:MAG: hypothetical protein WAV95_04955 [Azonexus sp.]
MSDLLAVLISWPWRGQLVIGCLLASVLGVALAGVSTLYYRHFHDIKVSIYPPWWTWVAVGIPFLILPTMSWEAKHAFVLTDFLRQDLRYFLGFAFFVLFGLFQGKEVSFRPFRGLRPEVEDLANERKRNAIPHHPPPHQTAQETPGLALWRDPAQALAELRSQDAEREEAAEHLAAPNKDDSFDLWQWLPGAIVLGLLIVLLVEKGVRTSFLQFLFFGALTVVIIVLIKFADRWPWLGLLASGGLAYHAISQWYALSAVAGRAGWLGLLWGIYILLVACLTLLVLYTSLRTLFGFGMRDDGQ